MSIDPVSLQHNTVIIVATENTVGNMKDKKQQVSLQMLLKSNSSWMFVAAIFLVGTMMGTLMSSFHYEGASLMRSSSIIRDVNSREHEHELLRSSPLELLTVGEMKKAMRLPCNYAHDGFYVQESNTIMEQVYQTLLELDDDDVPVVIESGGHDGISKSVSLKPSVCFHMNTLLIEASPSNYDLLSMTRAYDHVIHAALCDKDHGYVEIEEHSTNSGQNKIKGETTRTETQPGKNKVNCTTVDAEMDKLKAALPEEKKDKLKLVLLVLDVEGYEAVAIQGIQKYSPMKAQIENKYMGADAKKTMEEWSNKHNLQEVSKCPKKDDTCYNFKVLGEQEKKKLNFGTRKYAPENTWRSSIAQKAYNFY